MADTISERYRVWRESVTLIQVASRFLCDLSENDHFFFAVYTDKFFPWWVS